MEEVASSSQLSIQSNAAIPIQIYTLDHQQYFTQRPRNAPTGFDMVKIEFYCKTCSCYFSSSEEFDCHNLLCHSRKNKLTCPHCDIVFKRFDHLKRHIQMHEIKDFCQCPICSKDFCKRDDLTNHFNTEHSNVKPIPCGKCSFSCDSPNEFHKHDRSHFTTEHICFHCHKMFRRKDHLKRHMQTQHSDDKEKCVICSKDFKRKDHLLRHLREKHGKNLKNGWLVEFNEKDLKKRRQSPARNVGVTKRYSLKLEDEPCYK